MSRFKMSLTKKNSNLFRYFCHVYSIYIFFTNSVLGGAEIIEKCDIALQLEDSNINANLVEPFLCLVEELSNYNSSAVKKSVGFQRNQTDKCEKYTLGLFQISNNWCSTPHDEEFGSCKLNGCHLDCFKLLDTDITDDIECIKLIHEQNGFSKWPPITVSQCRRGVVGRANSDWNVTECLIHGRHHKRKLTSIPLWAALLIVAVSSLAVFSLTYFFYRYRRNSANILSTLEIKHFKYGRISSMRHVPSPPRLSQFLPDNFADEPYNNDLEVSPSQFAIDYNKCLGAGAYGIVYKASCKGRVVAVKTVKQHATKEYFQSLLGEIQILSYVGRNDFIVNLEGAHTRNLHKGSLYVFMEYCALGSLEKFLRSNRKNYSSLEEIAGDNIRSADSEENLESIGTTLTLKHLLQYSHQIARGMEFLASKQVIHGDLASRNVLLVDPNFAKICDFGLSRKLYGYINYIKKKEEPLPWRWMAVESLRENNFSTKSDCWMFGVTLFEIFSLGEVPYPGLSWSLEFVDKLEKGFRMLKPKYAPNNIYEDIMIKCWETNPTQRPSFSCLTSHFHQTLQKITAKDYTELVIEDKECIPGKEYINEERERK